MTCNHHNNKCLKRISLLFASAYVCEHTLTFVFFLYIFFQTNALFKFTHDGTTIKWKNKRKKNCCIEKNNKNTLEMFESSTYARRKEKSVKIVSQKRKNPRNERHRKRWDTAHKSNESHLHAFFVSFRSFSNSQAGRQK